MFNLLPSSQVVRHKPGKSRLLTQTVEAVRGARVRVNGRWSINFAAANYLGLNQHPFVRRAICRASTGFNLGTTLAMPRALATDPLTNHLEAEMARLVGQEDALLFPSTTHIALDVLRLLAGANGVIFLDAWAYPISLDGAALAAKRGASIVRFSHNNVDKLARQLAACPHAASKVIVCDGVYAAGGGRARLRQFAHLARRFNAVLYVDDAHGLGVWGTGAARVAGYGVDGAGTPASQQVPPGRHLVYVASFAKALSVPVAFVAGTKRFIGRLRREAPALVHSSPPAIPLVAAARAALRVHAAEGQTRRGRLWRRVQHFRRQLHQAGIPLAAGHFPIQTLPFTKAATAVQMAHHLHRQRIWPVLQMHPPDYPSGAVVRLILTAEHSHQDMDTAVAAVIACYRAVTNLAEARP